MKKYNIYNSGIPSSEDFKEYYAIYVLEKVPRSKE